VNKKFPNMDINSNMFKGRNTNIIASKINKNDTKITLGLSRYAILCTKEQGHH